MGALGFDGVEPEATGRPAYHPATRSAWPVSQDCSAMFSHDSAGERWSRFLSRIYSSKSGANDAMPGVLAKKWAASASRRSSITM